MQRKTSRGLSTGSQARYGTEMPFPQLGMAGTFTVVLVVVVVVVVVDDLTAAPLGDAVESLFFATTIL